MALTRLNNNAYGETISVAKGGTGVTTSADLANTGHFIKIKEVSLSGSVGSVEFIDGTDDVVFDSTYNRYYFTFMGIASQTDVHNLACQLGNSSGYITTSGKHDYQGMDMYQSAANTARGQSATFWTFGGVGASNASNEQNTNGEMWLTIDGSNYPNYFSRISYWQDNNNSVTSRMGGNLSDTSTIDRIKFFYHSNYNSTIVGTTSSFANQGSITMYGIRT